jgi:hypothetical protein
VRLPPRRRAFKCELGAFRAVTQFRPPDAYTHRIGNPLEDVVSINSTRSLLYQIARLLGDVNAVQKGKVGKRIARRAAGRLTGRGLGRLFR